MNAETSAPTPTTVIIGAGQAGGDAALSLRTNGYTGRIVLIGEEDHLPYKRPPLSKAFLSGQATLESLYVKPQASYDKANVEVWLNAHVTTLDRAAKQVTLADGRELVYDNLILATGGRPRKLAMANADQPNVHYVRRIDDIVRLRDDFVDGRNLVIIGGGYIGLEVAAVAVKAGLKVSVIEALPRVLARVTAPEISAFYEEVHRGQGVEIRTGVGVAGFEAADGKATAVLLADGSRLPADSVIVGIGLIPNTELAQAAGLEIGNGILVDRSGRTSDPSIFAIGDCTDHDNGFLGRRMRLESVPNAMEQARVAAANITGKTAEYNVAPWFWSDQYEHKLQMVGISQGYDQLVIRGDLAARSFAAFYLKDGVVISVDTVNRPQEFAVAKRFVGERLSIDPAKLSDETIVLKTLLPVAAPAAPAG